MNARRISSRIFDADDQQAFAALSGDVNPMHMDALQARRAQAGARVVHGMHPAAAKKETCRL
jgi:acyl dehydratase